MSELNIIYSIEGDHAVVTGYSGEGDTATILSEYEGYPVTRIGESAFGNCATLISVAIPNSVTSIGDCAFKDCSSLTSVLMDIGITSIGRDAFLSCTNLVNITLPASIISIGWRAFWRCYNLETVILPAALTEIASNTFAECYKLTVVKLGPNVSTISSDAFRNSGVHNINLSNVKFIGRNAFSYLHTSLPFLELDLQSITYLDPTAFDFCGTSVDNLKIGIGFKPTSYTDLPNINNTSNIYYYGTPEGWVTDVLPYVTETLKTKEITFNPAAANIGYFKQEDEKMLIKTKGSLVNGLAAKLNEVQTSINTLNTEIENTDKIFTFTEVYKEYN